MFNLFKKDELHKVVVAGLWALLFVGIVIGFIGDIFRIPVLLTIAKIMTMTFFALVIVLLFAALFFGVGYLVISFTIRINHEED